MMINKGSEDQEHFEYKTPIMHNGILRVKGSGNLIFSQVPYVILIFNGRFPTFQEMEFIERLMKEVYPQLLGESVKKRKPNLANFGEGLRARSSLRPSGLSEFDEEDDCSGGSSGRRWRRRLSMAAVRWASLLRISLLLLLLAAIATACFTLPVEKVFAMPPIVIHQSVFIHRRTLLDGFLVAHESLMREMSGA
ncbi:hypothetical protein QJS04_geneDACA003406 [Acorus gramineus]|uniref:Uncharacterized protein n=1 Tax=Acorus gramineus TaxID=55184 RepID=A0AAV9BQL7_ACOGR|nr:hypothetical protein QJS04_geneDACA003406 [Acorus gramineus]